MNDNFSDKKVDAGAGVSFSQALDNVERAEPTPPASLYGNYPEGTQQPQPQLQSQQQHYNANDFHITDQGNLNHYSGFKNGGFSLSSALRMPSEPIYVKLQEDPSEVKKRNIFSSIQLGTSLVVALIVLILIISASMQSNSGINSHHVLVNIKDNDVRFSDVNGCDEVKLQLERIVQYLKDPSEFEKFGADLPRGYLLSGPPGVGKTMLAKAVAGESGVSFFAISGAEFDEVYVGVGASRVRSLFRDARNSKVAVIFIDEIDAIAGKRNSGDSSVSRQTINQLLVEMDGFKTNNKNIKVIVLAASNSPESLDPAILRPGRFDKVLKLTPPDLNGRDRLLTNLIGKIPKDKLDGVLENNNMMWLAKITIGYTGADLVNLVNQAKLIAAAEVNNTVIKQEHFYKAKNFIDFGPERDQITNDDDIKRVAYHEAGHAIVGLVNQEKSKEFAIEHATIIPHGDALGFVSNVPQRDLCHTSLEMLKHRMDLALGGFMGEKRIYGNENEVSTGASSDLQSVNIIARIIVNAGFGKTTKFLHMPQNPLYSSEQFKQNYEKDMSEIIEESKGRVEDLLARYDTAWKALANELIKKKTLNRAQIDEIFRDNQPTN